MSNSTTNQLPPEIRGMLQKLRTRIRLYVWIEGIAAVVAVLGIAFWLGLAIDRLFEPAPTIRLVALCVVGVLVVYLIYREILSRAFARLADTSMAVLLEKYSDRFHDSLLTSVELSSEPDHASDFNREMLEHTSQEALQQVPNARLSEVFNPAPLLRNVVAALILVATITVFGVYKAEAMGFFLQRLQLSEELWPRQTRLIAEGFEDGVVKVARGASLELQVRADNTLKRPPPNRVEIRYTLDDGSRGRGDMSRIGDAVPGQDEFQEYSYTFKDVFESHTFDVIGGDDRIRDLRIEVVENPEIVGMQLGCEYPAYMNRSPRTLTVSGAMEVARDTKITLKAETNKDLVEVKIVEGQEAEPKIVSINQNHENKRAFEFTIDRLDQDRLLLIFLKDHDGIETIEPYRLSITAVIDEVPNVAVALRGIGTAITPKARIPVVGKIEDDYGVDRIWFEHQVDTKDPLESPFVPQAKGENELAVEQVMDVSELNLEPKQKFFLRVKAGDRYDLGEEPNVGASQRFLLDVVTADQMRVLLESRELMLRKQFETIYGEMSETRDFLSRVEFNEPKKEDAAETPPGDDEESEPKVVSPEERAKRALARRKLQVVRALQNVQRAGHEVLSVANSFDEIREELINNQMDTVELKTRLKDGIADPLKEIGGPMISDLEKQLLELDKLSDNAESGPAQLRKSIAGADKVLVSMKEVLDRMLELESYNQVLELLRAILQDQQIINDKTKELRKKKLRNLLDE